MVAKVDITKEGTGNTTVNPKISPQTTKPNRSICATNGAFQFF
jgi:hypothetical protein